MIKLINGDEVRKDDDDASSRSHLIPLRNNVFYMAIDGTLMKSKRRGKLSKRLTT